MPQSNLVRGTGEGVPCQNSIQTNFGIIVGKKGDDLASMQSGILAIELGRQK